MFFGGKILNVFEWAWFRNGLCSIIVAQKGAKINFDKEIASKRKYVHLKETSPLLRQICQI